MGTTLTSVVSTWVNITFYVTCPKSHKSNKDEKKKKKSNKDGIFLIDHLV